MKKIIPALIIIGVLIGSFFIFSYYNFKNYPNSIIATSKTIDGENKFYLNGTLTGDGHGFCTVIRDEKNTVIKLVNKNKEETIVISNNLRFNIAESSGDNLGLQVIKANADPDLRKEFGCKY
jgi:hypothetical protein